MNAVLAAVGIMLVLSLCRIHVVVALIIGALAGGLIGGLGMEATLAAFNKGLGAGATVALSYALLGAFAVAAAVVRMGLPRLTAHVAEWQVIYSATLVAAVVLLLDPLMPGPWAMGLCSVLLGLALGAVQPMILVVLHRISPEARQGEAMALRVMTINSSSFVLPMMFGSIGAVTGVAGLFWLVAAVLAVGSRSVPKLRDVQPHG